MAPRFPYAWLIQSRSGIDRFESVVSLVAKTREPVGHRALRRQGCIQILGPYKRLLTTALTPPLPLYDALYAACSLIAFVSLFYSSQHHGILGNVRHRPLCWARHSFGVEEIRFSSPRHRRLPLLAPSPLFHRLGHRRLRYQPYYPQSRDPADALDCVSTLIYIRSLHASAIAWHAIPRCILGDAASTQSRLYMLTSRL